MLGDAWDITRYQKRDIAGCNNSPRVVYNYVQGGRLNIKMVTTGAKRTPATGPPRTFKVRRPEGEGDKGRRGGHQLTKTGGRTVSGKKGENWRVNEKKPPHL